MKLSVFMTRRQTLFGWVLVLLHMIVLPLLLAGINQFLPRPLSLAQLNIVLFFTIFILALGIFYGFLKANFRIVKKDVLTYILWVLAGFGIYMAGNIAVNLAITVISPDFSNVNDAAIADMSTDHYWLMWICTVLLVPTAEECMYRGLFFQGLYRKGRVLAYAVSVLAFAAIHVVGYIGTADTLTLALCLLQYFPAGFALAWAYEQAGTIWAPILIHMLVNCIGMNAMR